MEGGHENKNKKITNQWINKSAQNVNIESIDRLTKKKLQTKAKIIINRKKKFVFVYEKELWKKSQQ